jgi:hypothetical protein
MLYIYDKMAEVPAEGVVPPVVVLAVVAHPECSLLFEKVMDFVKVIFYIG